MSLPKARAEAHQLLFLKGLEGRQVLSLKAFGGYVLAADRRTCWDGLSNIETFRPTGSNGSPRGGVGTVTFCGRHSVNKTNSTRGSHKRCKSKIKPKSNLVQSR